MVGVKMALRSFLLTIAGCLLLHLCVTDAWTNPRRPSSRCKTQLPLLIPSSLLPDQRRRTLLAPPMLQFRPSFPKRRSAAAAPLRTNPRVRWFASSNDLENAPNGHNVTAIIVDAEVVSTEHDTAATSTILTSNTTAADWTERMIQNLPRPLVTAWENSRFAALLAQHWTLLWRTVLTLTIGAVLGVAALVVPMVASVHTLAQPVTLFETILSDLEQAYVDPVDTQQLFETGVAAMLRSLDPYTEFEGVQEAVDMTESIEGKYGGVGLVIASRAVGGDKDTTSTDATKQPPPDRSIRVVSAFEGYAFDYGMRVGDTILAVDDVPVQDAETGKTISIDQVRSRLRGTPGTTVRISFLREGVPGVQQVEMPRSVVQIRDVKLATLLGNPANGIGYIQLSGFASDAGREMRQAIAFLQQSAEDAAQGERSLQGLILDLRGNPGGLLTSAVDVASLLVPKGSDIVSAKGRGFPGILYRSRVEPMVDTKTTKLAVLVNGNTASAAEIVSGAVQDLDVGIIVGTDRTFGKGLVQNVEELPYNTALKFTVAKYYTPSGRCIQGMQYAEGDRRENDGKYVETKIEEKDRGIFYTRLGRVVRDGGGVEADYKIPSTKASALEMTLYRSNVFADFAAEWSRNHELTEHFSVDEDTYKSFQAFVQRKQKSGELQLEALYGKPLEDLKKALSASGYSGSEKSVEQLQARIVREIQDDFDKYRNDIKEDISQSILARYVPESMLIERGIQRDPQVEAAVKLLSSPKKFDRLLAKGSIAERTGYAVGNSLQVAAQSSETTSSSSTPTSSSSTDGFRSAIKW